MLTAITTFISCLHSQYRYLSYQISHSHIVKTPRPLLPHTRHKSFSGIAKGMVWGCSTGTQVVKLQCSFEPSSPSQYGTEIVSILGERAIDYPVVFLYTMGGQTIGVKRTLIAVFRKVDHYGTSLSEMVREEVAS